MLQAQVLWVGVTLMAGNNVTKVAGACNPYTAAASGVTTDPGSFQRPPMVGGDGDDTQQLWIMTLNKAASRHIEI
ncbi:unnamed protein product [Sphagnum balticum]